MVSLRMEKTLDLGDEGPWVPSQDACVGSCIQRGPSRAVTGEKSSVYGAITSPCGRGTGGRKAGPGHDPGAKLGQDCSRSGATWESH